MKNKLIKTLSVLALTLMLAPTIKADAATTGWTKTTKGYQWVKTDGTYAKSEWVKSKGNWYFINKNGVRHKGWLTIDGNTYYLNKSGIRVTDWERINDEWYFFDENGVLMRNTYVDIWTTNSKGAIEKEDYIDLMVDELTFSHIEVIYNKKNNKYTGEDTYPYKSAGYFYAGGLGLSTWSDKIKFTLEYDTSLATVKVVRSSTTSESFDVIIKPKKAGKCDLKITASHPGCEDYVWNSSIYIYYDNSDDFETIAGTVGYPSLVVPEDKDGYGQSIYFKEELYKKYNSRLPEAERLLIFEYKNFKKMMQVNNALVDPMYLDFNEKYTMAVDTYVDPNLTNKVLNARAKYLYNAGGLDDHEGYTVFSKYCGDGEILSMTNGNNVFNVIRGWAESRLHSACVFYYDSTCVTPLAVKTKSGPIYALIYTTPEKSNVNFYSRYNFEYK